MDFKDNTVLITGASRGIGRAIALAFGEKQANVIINYHTNHEAAEATATEVRDRGGQAICFQADVKDLASVQEMIKTANEAFPPCSILVNNAGILQDNLTPFMTEEQWHEVIDTSLTGAFHCTKVLSRQMARKRYGRIINISSAAGLSGDIMRANYASAKAGLIGLTKANAREFAKSNITVNAIAPGAIETNLLQSVNEDKRDKQKELIPLRRFGSPREVADLTCFLASDAAGYITGQVIAIDGGMTM